MTTVDSLTKEVFDNLEGDPNPGHDVQPKQFGFILLIVIGAVLTHYVEKCLDWIDPPKIQNPNAIERAYLYRLVKQQIRKQPSVPYRQASNVYDAIIKTFSAKSHEQISEMANKIKGERA